MIRFFKYFIFFLVVGCIHINAFSQNGEYYVRGYVIEPDRLDNPYFSIISDTSGLIFVSNRSGVIQYDGNRWSRTECPGAVYDMDRTADYFIVGGKFGFGKIAINNSGSQQFQLLGDSLENTGNIHSVAIKHNLGYFVNPSELLVYDLKTDDLRARVKLDSNKQFLNLLHYENDLLVMDSYGGIHQIVGYEISTYANFDRMGGRPVFIESHSNGQTLVGTNENDLFLLESNQYKKLVIEDENYLKDNDITSAEWLSDTLVAVGTLKGGVAFINPIKKTLTQVTNSQTGLTDNEVLGLKKDMDNGLWVAQQNGIDRVDPFLPLKNFSHYPGLNGDVLTIYPTENELFVSTSLGVFKLKEIRDYDKIVKTIRIPVDAHKEPEIDSVDEEPKRGFLGIIRKNKKKKKPTSEGFFKRIFGSDKNDTDTVRLAQQVIQELKGINYHFERIKGINTKNTFFEVIEGHLVNGGLTGLFEIKGDSSHLISPLPIRDILITSDKILVASTADGKVLFFQLSNNNWREVDRIDGLNDDIQFILEDKDNNLWFAGIDAIYKLNKINNGAILNEYLIKNPFSDRTIMLQGATRVYAVNPSGYFYFDENENRFIEDNQWNQRIGLAKKYFGNDPKDLWLYNGDFWYSVKNDDTFFSRELLLSMVKDINFISYDKQKDVFWVTTINNDIFRLDNIRDQLGSNYSLLLKDVRQQGSALQLGSITEVEEQGGKITFEYIHPDYSGVLGIQYRYKLEGLDNTWSEWTDDNRIEFPYLPPGDYSIIVQSKDIFGQVNESAPLQFEVVPPYWQQPWFYASEFLFFIVLLSITIRLNRKSGERFSVISRLFAFLTLILLLEFVQAIAEAKFQLEQSPIFNFSIQVMIAAAILPFENILRKWLTGQEKVQDIFRNLFVKKKQEKIKG